MNLDLSLSESEEMLSKTALDFMQRDAPKEVIQTLQETDTGYTEGLWRKVSEMGWLGVIIPEQYDGTGNPLTSAGVLFEALGTGPLPGPYFSSGILGSLIILEAGNEEQKQRILPSVAEGKQILTLALTEPSSRYDAEAITVTATADGDEYILNGTKLFVPDAHIADYILCVARTSQESNAEKGITIFIVDSKTPGVKCTVLNTIAKDKLCEVVLNKVRVPKQSILGELGEGWSQIQKIIEHAAIAKCCEMVGGMEQVLDMTVDYAKTRIQFGHPIGSFQIIQHYCVDMMLDLDCSRFATCQAAWMLCEGLPCTREVSIAKAWASYAYQHATAKAHEIYAGMGFTIDCDLHFYSKRAKAAAVTFGDAYYHKQVLAREIGL